MWSSLLDAILLLKCILERDPSYWYRISWCIRFYSLPFLSIFLSETIARHLASSDVSAMAHVRFKYDLQSTPTLKITGVARSR